MVMLLATSLLTNAQTWQWGKRGGSAEAGTGGPDETVVSMATDTKGNIYILSKVLQTSLNLDSHTITGWGGQDILLSSFKCDGTYRWSKDIGSSSTDYPVALKTDTIGGVYVTGALFCDFVTDHLSTDSSWAANSFKTLFLLKYDTAGNYKWFRMPEPDSVNISSPGNTYPYDLDVDGGGNCYLLSVLDPGGYAGGAYIVTTTSTNILKYDKNGNFLGGNSMQISFTGGGANLLMKKNFLNGKYYITGSLNTGTMSFAGTPITHALFVGCFNNSGTFLWQKQDCLYGGGFARPVVDGSGDIYLTSSSTTNDTFNTYIVTNAFYPAPFIAKMDSNGTLLWAKNATTNGTSFSNTTILNGPEIDIAGTCGKLKWPGYSDSLNLAFGLGYHVFITRFNYNTGNVIGIDTLVSTSNIPVDAMAMTADKYGNIYIGGDFASSITVAGTTLNSIGGGSDFFIAKYGTANCTGAITLETPPEPGKFSITGIHVFPNPATDELNITGVPQATSYRLLSITGTTQMQGPLQEGSNSLPVQRLATGIYLLEMTGADGARTIVRVVKE